MDIVAILNSVGLSPALVGVIVGAVLLFERIGKIIPDDAEGVLGMIRKVAKVLGGYVENQKSSE
jgi:hypothetical protein